MKPELRSFVRPLLVVLLFVSACGPSAQVREARRAQYAGEYSDVFATMLDVVKSRYHVAYANAGSRLIITCWEYLGTVGHPGDVRPWVGVGRIAVHLEGGPPWRVRVQQLVLSGRTSAEMEWQPSQMRVNTPELDDLSVAIYSRLRSHAATAATSDPTTDIGLTPIIKRIPNDGCPDE